MKKQNEMEIRGVGALDIFSVKVEKKEFSLVTPELKEVKTQRTATSGTKTEYTDGEKTWEKSQLGYNINGRFIQKVEKTDKVVKFELMDKTDVIGNFLADSWYVVVPKEETEARLKEMGVYDDKAMVFTYKKSSTGMSFHRAILYCSNGVLRMDTAEKPAFWTDIAAQVKAELTTKNAIMAALAENKQEIVVKASEIVVEV